MDAVFRLMQLSEYIKAARRTSITTALLARLGEAGRPGRSSGESVSSNDSQILNAVGKARQQRGGR